MDRLSPKAAKEFAVKAATIEETGDLFDLLCDALMDVRGQRVAYFHLSSACPVSTKLPFGSVTSDLSACKGVVNVCG